MTPRLSFAAVRRRSAGIGIVTAIFLLVVLSGLAAALVALSSTQSQSSALDEQGVRAGAPKKYSWSAAFGLTVTLVWLYVEILRILAILRGND